MTSPWSLPRLAFHENLPNERGDRLDGIRHREKSHQRQTGIRQACMNALADGPDSGLAGQRLEGLHRMIDHHLIELAHQPLVGTEHDRADRTPTGVSLCAARPSSRRLALPKASAQPQLHGPVVVCQGAHGPFVLSDTRGGHGLHRADDGLEISRRRYLSAKARRACHSWLLRRSPCSAQPSGRI